MSFDTNHPDYQETISRHKPYVYWVTDSTDSLDSLYTQLRYTGTQGTQPFTTHYSAWAIYQKTHYSAWAIYRKNCPNYPDPPDTFKNNSLQNTNYPRLSELSEPARGTNIDNNTAAKPRHIRHQGIVGH
jgi:hypothetical protein